MLLLYMRKSCRLNRKLNPCCAGLLSSVAGGVSAPGAL